MCWNRGMTLWLSALLFCAGGFEGIPGFSGTAGIPNDEVKLPQDPGSTSGPEFLVVFLQNMNVDKAPSRDVLVTGISPLTTITASINNMDFNKTYTVKKGETVTIPYPVEKELKGTGFSEHPMIIKADSDVIAMSRSYRENSGDTALLYPKSHWGTEYFITGPSEGPKNESQEFSVTSGSKPTIINIYMSGAITFNRRKHKRGDKMTVNMKPNTTFQVQSKDGLSGTRITANHPVVVMTGHTCAQGRKSCSHVFYQLQQVPHWATLVMIPGMPNQPTYDMAYVMAPKETTITYTTDKGRVDKSVQPGEQIEIPIQKSSPVSVTSKDGVQVLFFGRGGEINNQPVPPFTSLLPGTENVGLSFTLVGQDIFNVTFGIITALTRSISGIRVDGEPADTLQWKQIPGTEYSYSVLNNSRGGRAHTIQHPTEPFSVLGFGYSKNLSYGLTAQRIPGSL